MKEEWNDYDGNGNGQCCKNGSSHDMSSMLHLLKCYVTCNKGSHGNSVTRLLTVRVTGVTA